LIVATTIVGIILQASLFWVQLPEKMATHFDAGGQPDGWMSKAGFIAFAVLMQAGLAGIMFGVGKLIRVVPASMVNIPNRDYWLTEERREQTFDETESMLAWIAAGTSIFLLVICCLVLDANVGEKKGFSSFSTWVAVVVYLAWLLVFCVLKLRKYYRLPIQ
jgi:uncharacterized membrane protein